MSLHKLALAQHLYTTGETGSRVQLACTLAQLRLIAASVKIQQKSQPCVRSVQSEQSEHSEVLSAFQLLHSQLWAPQHFWSHLEVFGILGSTKCSWQCWQSGTQPFLCCFPKAPPTFPRSARLQDCNSFRLLLGPWAFLFLQDDETYNRHGSLRAQDSAHKLWSLLWNAKMLHSFFRFGLERVQHIGTSARLNKLLGFWLQRSPIAATTNALHCQPNSKNMPPYWHCLMCLCFAGRGQFASAHIVREAVEGQVWPKISWKLQ